LDIDYKPKEALRISGCFGGARNCPPECIGEPKNYKNFRKIILNPKYEDFKKMYIMVEEESFYKIYEDEDFDPEKFNYKKADL
jgi:hypothetical protein